MSVPVVLDIGEYDGRCEANGEYVCEDNETIIGAEPSFEVYTCVEAESDEDRNEEYEDGVDDD